MTSSDNNRPGEVERIWPPINPQDQYLIRSNFTRTFVSSTDDLGISLPIGYCLIDTIGEDGLGTVDGRCGIPDFLAALTQQEKTDVE